MRPTANGDETTERNKFKRLQSKEDREPDADYTAKLRRRVRNSRRRSRRRRRQRRRRRRRRWRRQRFFAFFVCREQQRRSLWARSRRLHTRADRPPFRSLSLPRPPLLENAIGATFTSPAAAAAASVVIAAVCSATAVRHTLSAAVCFECRRHAVKKLVWRPNRAAPRRVALWRRNRTIVSFFVLIFVALWAHFFDHA